MVLFITSVVTAYKVCTSSWSYLLHQWWLRTSLYVLMVLFITSMVIVYKVCTSSWSYLLHQWWLCTRFVRGHGPIYYISGDCVQGLYELMGSYLSHQWWLCTRFVRAHCPIYYISGDCVQGLYDLMGSYLLHQWWLCTRFVRAHGPIITSVVIVYKVCTSSWVPIYYISGDCVQGLYELMVLFITSVVTVYTVCTSSWGPIYYISGDCVHSLYELMGSYLLHQWWLRTRFVWAHGVLFITSMVIVYKVCTSSWSYLLHQWWLCTRFVRALGPIYYINGDCLQGLYELMVLFITSVVIVYKVCTSSWSYLLHQWWLCTRFVRAHGPIYYISGDCVQGLYELMVLFITSMVIVYKVCTSSWSYLLHQWWLCTRFVWAHGPIYYISGDCVQGLYKLMVLFITSVVIVYKVCISSWSYLLHQWWLCKRFVWAHGVLFITSVVIVYKVCTSSWSYLLHQWWLCTRFVRAHGVLFITSVVIVYKVCIRSWSYLLHQWWLCTRFVRAHGPIYYINGDCVQGLYELIVLFITSVVIVYKVCMSSWSYLLHQWWLRTLYELMVLFITSVVTASKVCMSSWSYLLHQWWLHTRFVRAHGPIYYINSDCVQGLYKLLVLFITSVVIAYKVCMSSWSYLLHQ